MSLACNLYIDDLRVDNPYPSMTDSGGWQLSFEVAKATIAPALAVALDITHSAAQAS